MGLDGETVEAFNDRMMTQFLVSAPSVNAAGELLLFGEVCPEAALDGQDEAITVIEESLTLEAYVLWLR
jgi:hypothetical protein